MSNLTGNNQPNQALETINASILQKENGIFVVSFIYDGQEYRGVCLPTFVCSSSCGLNPNRVPEHLRSSILPLTEPIVKENCPQSSSSSTSTNKKTISHFDSSSSPSYSTVADRFTTRISSTPLAINYQIHPKTTQRCRSKINRHSKYPIKKLPPPPPPPRTSSSSATTTTSNTAKMQSLNMRRIIVLKHSSSSGTNANISVPRFIRPHPAPAAAAIPANQHQSTSTTISLNNFKTNDCVSSSSSNIVVNKTNLLNNCISSSTSAAKLGTTSFSSSFSIPLASNSIPLTSWQSANGDCFELGNIVWGKVTGYPYWPGRICELAHNSGGDNVVPTTPTPSLNVNNSTTSNNVVNRQSVVIARISWLGSNKISYLPCDRLYHFRKHFLDKFDKKKRGVYLDAVKMALMEVNIQSTQ